MPRFSPLLLIAVGLSAIVYSPVLKNYFWADDFLHLFRLVNTPLLEFILTQHAGHLCLVVNTLFYFFYQAFGLDPQPFFVLALATHLINVGLLFHLIRRLTDSPTVACFGATLWGICPTNEGSVGWYCVFGHVVAATVSLWLWSDVVRCAAVGRSLSTRRIVAWYVAALIAVTCFGVGLGVAMALPFFIFLVFQPGAERIRLTATFAPLVVVAPGVYAVFQWLYLLVAAAPEHQVASMVQSVTLWRPIVAMLGGLMVYGTGSLAIPYGLGTLKTLTPAHYAATALCGIATLLVVVRSTPQIRRQLLAFALSAAAIYGIIAVGRGPFFVIFAAPLNSAVSALRYHYAGTAAIAVILSLVLKELGRRLPLRDWQSQALLFAWLVATVVLYLTIGPQIDHNDQARAEVHAVQARVAAILDHTPAGQPAYIVNTRFVAAFWNPTHLFPDCAGIFLLTYPDNVVNGHRVYFVENNADALAVVRRSPLTRAAALIIGSQDVPTTVPER